MAMTPSKAVATATALANPPLLLALRTRPSSTRYWSFFRGNSTHSKYAVYSTETLRSVFIFSRHELPRRGPHICLRRTSSSKALDGLSDSVNLWARDYGYTVSIARNENKSGKRRRVLVACSRAGFPRYRIPEAREELVQGMKEAGLRKPYKKRGNYGKVQLSLCP
jgi:hypothetical protein